MMSMSFPVEADVTEFDAAVEVAVQNALVKFGILVATVDGKVDANLILKTNEANQKANAFFQEVDTKAKAVSYKFKARADVDMGEMAKKWQWETNAQIKGAEARLNRTEFGIKMTLRLLYSEINQTWSMVANLTGLSKNAMYQIMSSVISGVVGLISTANLAASTLALIPGIGPFLAALSVGNAVAGTMLSISLGISQMVTEQRMNELTGQQLEGVSF